MALGFGRSKKTKETQSGAEWPSINDLLWVRLPCCETAIHPSRVEGETGDDLIIAAPSKPHIERLPLPIEDRTFIVGWSLGASCKQVKVQATSGTEGELATWTIHALSPVELLQRRQFVRANWDQEVTLYLPTLEGATKGTILDISEGGIRCVIPVTNEPRNPHFEVSFNLGDEPILLPVEIAWWGQPTGDGVVVALQFMNQQSAMSDLLRALAFDLQMKERRDRHR